jgi:hypothetical protein
MMNAKAVKTAGAVFLCAGELLGESPALLHEGVPLIEFLLLLESYGVGEGESKHQPRLVPSI